MTVVERKTIFYALIKVKSKQSKDMIEVFRLFYERYGKVVRTITADNGSEFISWDFLECVQKGLKIKRYYCTPASPHQRGSNENRNGKLRIALQGKCPVELFDKEYKTMQRYRRAYERRKLRK